MATAAASYISLPVRLFATDESDANVLRIPPDAHTWEGFHRWLDSGQLPEKMRTHFIHGSVYLDISEESIQTHVAVKSGIFATLIPIMVDEDLGEFYPDGILVRNKKAMVSNNPDGVAALWETIESGRVRFIERNGQEVILEGSPDWMMEIISNSSVAKDTKVLRQAYHDARIPEYWLIDARGDDIKFQILHWRKAGYVAATVKDGWQHSRVFGRDFQLVRKRNRRGAWHYTLEVKP
jgi:Uma2 family endonuclease